MKIRKLNKYSQLKWKMEREMRRSQKKRTVSNRGDKLDDELGHVVSWGSLPSNQDRARHEATMRILLDPFNDNGVSAMRARQQVTTGEYMGTVRGT